MLAFKFTGNFALSIMFSGLELFLIICICGIALGLVAKAIAKRFKQ